MSEIEESPPRSWQQFSEEPSGLYGPFFNGEQSRPRFPDYEFQIQAHRLVADGVFEITPESRLRYCLRTIKEQCEYDLPNIAAFANNTVIKLEKNNQKKYLSAKITLLSGGNTQRKNLVDQPLAYDQVMGGLHYLNHPAAQLFEQVIAQDQLAQSELQNLEADLVTVMAWPDLKLVYQAQVTSARTTYIAPPPSNS